MIEVIVTLHSAPQNKSSKRSGTSSILPAQSKSMLEARPIHRACCLVQTVKHCLCQRSQCHDFQQESQRKDRLASDICIVLLDGSFPVNSFNGYLKATRNSKYLKDSRYHICTIAMKNLFLLDHQLGSESLCPQY